MTIDFTVLDKEETLLISSVHDIFPDFSIPLYTFWNWVKKNELNLWVEDYYDARSPDGHGQQSGSFTLQEYFLLRHDLVEKDILKYIKQIDKSNY